MLAQSGDPFIFERAAFSFRGVLVLANFVEGVLLAPYIAFTSLLRSQHFEILSGLRIRHSVEFVQVVERDGFLGLSLRHVGLPLASVRLSDIISTQRSLRMHHRAIAAAAYLQAAFSVLVVVIWRLVLQSIALPRALPAIRTAENSIHLQRRRKL